MNRMDRPGLMLERARRAQRLGWACWVGLTIQTSRIRTKQARDLDWPIELDDPNTLSCVGLKDTSFRKFNLNFFYKNGFWILNLIQIFRLDLNLDPNI